MRKFRMAGLAALLALAVTGCTGPQLLDLNTDLTRLSQERAQIRAKAKPDEALIQLTHIDGELERLTDAALAAAQRAADAKSKVSYYRIAATAAWQRNDARTLDIAREGSAVCDANKGFDLSPRDCVMLLVIPDLTVNEAWARRLAEMRAEAGTPGLVAKYGVVVSDLLDSYDALGRAAARSGATPAPELLVQVIRERQATVGRNVGTVLTFLALNGTAPDHRNQISVLCNSIRARATAIVPAECKRF